MFPDSPLSSVFMMLHPMKHEPPYPLSFTNENHHLDKFKVKTDNEAENSEKLIKRYNETGKKQNTHLYKNMYCLEKLNLFDDSLLHHKFLHTYLNRHDILYRERKNQHQTK